MKYISAVVLAPVVIVVLFLLAAVVGAIIPGSHAQEDATTGPDHPPVYLVYNFLHTDIAIPLTDSVRERFAFLRNDGMILDDPRVKYLVFGWGARDFYTSTSEIQDIEFATIFKAVTGDRSVMHVLPAAGVDYFENHSELPMGNDAFEKLQDHILQSFYNPGLSKPLTNVGFGNHDAFYPARGKFNIFHPCNVWVTKGMKKAGLATGLWTPTVYSLELSRWLHEH